MESNKDIMHKYCMSTRNPLLHLAAECNTLNSIKRLLEIYPESALISNFEGYNILHCAMDDDDNDEPIVKDTGHALLIEQYPPHTVEKKMDYIIKRYPTLIHERTNRGFSPLHIAINNSKFNSVIAICQVDRLVIKDQFINDYAKDLHNLSLPLHL